MQRKAVSSVIGTMLMLICSILIFTVLYFSVTQGLIFEEPAPRVDLYGSKNGNKVTIIHQGGEVLLNWLLWLNGQIWLQGSNLHCGETISFDINSSLNNTVTLVSDNTVLFHGYWSGSGGSDSGSGGEQPPSVNQTLNTSFDLHFTSAYELLLDCEPSGQFVNATNTNDSDFTYLCFVEYTNCRPICFEVEDVNITGNITSIDVFLSTRALGINCKDYIALSLDDSNWYSKNLWIDTLFEPTYTMRSESWDINPQTGLNWSNTDVNNLHIKIGLMHDSQWNEVRCTHSFVRVHLEQEVQ